MLLNDLDELVLLFSHDKSHRLPVKGSVVSISIDQPMVIPASVACGTTLGGEKISPIMQSLISAFSNFCLSKDVNCMSFLGGSDPSIGRYGVTSAATATPKF